MYIQTDPLGDISVKTFNRLRPVIDFDPPYQREGSVWSPETRALLIDSIINGLDVPKIYFETYSRVKKSPSGLTLRFAVIDGKQRLQAIQEFLDNKLPLSDDFEFFEDDSINAAGMFLEQLASDLPLLAERFYSFELPIVAVTTDTDDLVEEMFQRLNASRSLNAAERRNAINSPTRDIVNWLAGHKLLTEMSPIRNARYKYRELSSKFLAIEYQYRTSGRVLDTKAATLYQLFMATKGADAKVSERQIRDDGEAVKNVLDSMADIFTPSDKLLRSIGTTVVYYITFRTPVTAPLVTRDVLERFEMLRKAAGQMTETNPDYARAANARLREYNSWVQSANDGRALMRRASILSAFIQGEAKDSGIEGLDRMSEEGTPEQDLLDEETENS